jgi:uncharacterized protein with PQ loop repeat
LPRRADRPQPATLLAMDLQIPELAGVIATVIFAVGTLPMVVKAARTKDLRSYSRSNIMLSNMGNVIQSIYVFSLPAGPIWALHSFYLVTTALMLLWCVRYTAPQGAPRRYTELPMPDAGTRLVNLPDAADRHPAIASRA